MKPRSKRQVLVSQLSERLPVLAGQLEPWAFKNCIDHVGYRNKMWTSCLSCGQVWPTTSMKIKTEVCPGCGWKLKLDTTRKQKARQWARFAVLDVVEDFQVIRFFDINCHLKASQKPRVYNREIMQHWILPDGEFEIISSQVGGLGLSYEHFGYEMSLKNKKDLWKYNIEVYKIYPKMKLFPIYKRNGFNARLTDIRPFDLLRILPSDPKVETLIKAKQLSLMSAHMSDRGSGTRRHWPSIKIAIRNNYIVKDAITWLDYLDLLNYFGKDLRSAKYVCTPHVAKEHDRLVKKKRDIEKLQDLERRKKQIEADQKRYEKAKAIFFGIAFTKQDLEVKVLQHVKDFIEEAETHKHCVYSNRYFDKEDSLILSAQVNGVRIETIEISLSQMKIVQSRGLQNKATDYHQRIIDLVNNGLQVISNTYEKNMKRELVA